ncbi:hypothetical protein RCL_jg18707.t1 [Rhizophagus clarus]|uniref:Uncharacterized protein n=1 Tax=Rhizophagus clarus TaxID=94130 RepID=A0A8H3LDP5_9GLOM|nr:hypothetical protein RCL_jg18707.t1 [Rhizophagus clarus]
MFHNQLHDYHNHMIPMPIYPAKGIGIKTLAKGASSLSSSTLSSFVSLSGWASSENFGSGISPNLTFDQSPCSFFTINGF